MKQPGVTGLESFTNRFGQAIQALGLAALVDKQL